jgi:hypothetical protein
MGKFFLPGIVRNILSQPLRLDTKGLCHPYGVITILTVMVLVALFLSYLMLTYCTDNCTSGNHTVSITEIKHRDLAFTCQAPGSIYIPYESNSSYSTHARNTSTLLLGALTGTAEKMPKLLSPLIT